MSQIKLVAISKDGLAGIMTHDKYWDRNGYRSVYFSFEPESSEGTIAKTLLLQATEWSMKWEFKDVSGLLGNSLRITKEEATRFSEELSKQKGEAKFSSGLILNELGGTQISISVTEPTKLNLLIVHPTSNRISVNVSSSAEIIEPPRVEDRITSVALKAFRSGKVTLILKANPDSILNPAYLVVKEENFDFSVSVSQSSLSIMQGNSASITVNVMSTQGIPQTTSLLATALPSGVAVNFNPAAGTPSFASILSIGTSSATPPGTYTVTVSATGGRYTHSATFTLTILPMMRPPQPAPQPVQQPAPQPEPRQAPKPEPQPAPQPQQPAPEPAPQIPAPQPQPLPRQLEPVAPAPARSVPPPPEQQVPAAKQPVPAPMPKQGQPRPVPEPSAVSENGLSYLGLPVTLGGAIAIAIGVALTLIRFRKK